MFRSFSEAGGQLPLSDCPVQFRVDPPRYQRSKPAAPIPRDRLSEAREPDFSLLWTQYPDGNEGLTR